MKTQPNILIITTHDTGRHLGCYGIDSIRTPHIDSLASQGVLLEKSFSTVPICCASRASQMTGRYPQSNGQMDLFFKPFYWDMHPEERHISNIMQDAGYHTRLFGIQHETGNMDRLGFDEAWREKVDCDAVSDKTCEFLNSDQAGERPFFAQIGFFETHSPFDWGGVVPDSSQGIDCPPYLVRNELSEELLAMFQGMANKADAAIGRIMYALEVNGLADDTIVVYTTDHGIEFPRAKWYVYDAGIEIACIWRWPNGNVEGGRRLPHLTSNVDFLPTLLELADITPQPGGPELQGISYAHNLRQETSTPTRDAIYAMYDKSDSRCVRTDTHKLIMNFRINKTWYSPVDMTKPAHYRVCPNVELFDLENDPCEFHNLADDPALAEVRQALSDKLWTWLEEVNDPILKGPVLTPYFTNTHGVYTSWKAARQAPA